MTPKEIEDARGALGELWGLGRPLKKSELGRALQLGGRDPGLHIANYEAGRSSPSKQTALIIRMWLAGAPLLGGVEALRGGGEA